MSSIASTGSPCSFCTASSDVRPVQPATWSRPIARATSTPLWIEWIHAEHEYGMTTPVVPRIESPPTIPRRGFQVFSASRSPSCTPISTITSPGAPCAAATSATVSRIIRRGTGLIAGSPTGTGRPGLVTVPTPEPARNATPLPAAPSRTVAATRAWWVTSGSSPASLMIPALAKPLPSASVASANEGRCPLGSTIVTGSGNSPVSNAVYAARVAAVAHAPVVQPRRRRFCSDSGIRQYYPA